MPITFFPNPAVRSQGLASLAGQVEKLTDPQRLAVMDKLRRTKAISDELTAMKESGEDITPTIVSQTMMKYGEHIPAIEIAQREEQLGLQGRQVVAAEAAQAEAERHALVAEGYQSQQIKMQELGLGLNVAMTRFTMAMEQGKFDLNLATTFNNAVLAYKEQALSEKRETRLGQVNLANFYGSMLPISEIYKGSTVPVDEYKILSLNRGMGGVMGKNAIEKFATKKEVSFEEAVDDMAYKAVTGGLNAEELKVYGELTSDQQLSLGKVGRYIYGTEMFLEAVNNMNGIAKQMSGEVMPEQGTSTEAGRVTGEEIPPTFGDMDYSNISVEELQEGLDIFEEQGTEAYLNWFIGRSSVPSGEAVEEAVEEAPVNVEVYLRGGQ